MVCPRFRATEAYDRGKKFAIYRQIPSLREYLLVSEHQVLVELYSRADGGRWTLAAFSALTDSVPLPNVGCTLSLAEVYDKVALQPV